MATFLARSLGNGVVPTAASELYAVAAGLKGYVKSLWLYNESGSSVVVILSLSFGGTPRTWRRIAFLPRESANVLEGEDAMVLSANNSILAESTADGVNYSVHGVEESA